MKTPEQNRRAQLRYRQRHAKQLAQGRRVAAILMRQSWHADKIEELANSLRALLPDECIRALRKELGPQREP